MSESKETTGKALERGAGIVGMKFHQLTVIKATVERNRTGKLLFECQCDCGKFCMVPRNSLVSGNSKSCGCRRLGHGWITAPEYKCWQGMIARCTNPNDRKFRLYGGRGILVCDRWRKFADFQTDMAPRPSPRHQLDRIDNNGNYEPGNVRWALPEVQHSNKRTNVVVELTDGRRMTLTQAATLLGWGKHHRKNLNRGRDGVREVNNGR